MTLPIYILISGSIAGSSSSIFYCGSGPVAHKCSPRMLPVNRSRQPGQRIILPAFWLTIIIHRWQQFGEPVRTLKSSISELMFMLKSQNMQISEWLL